MTRVLYVYYGTAGIAGAYIHGIGQAMEKVAGVECHLAVNYYYAFDEPGCKVIRVFFPLTEMDDENRFLRSGLVRSLRLPLRLMELIIAYLYLLCYIVVRRIDVVNLSLVDVRIITYLFAVAIRILGRELLITAHDSVPYVARAPMARRRTLFGLARKVIVHYDHVREDLVKYFDLPRSKVHVHPYPWSDVSSILDQAKLEEQLQSTRESVTGFHRIFLFVGVLRPEKGLADLTTAWIQAGFEPEDECLLVVAGRPVGGQDQLVPDTPAVMLIARYLGNEEFWALLTISDVVVMPYAVSYYAHSSVALMSYLAGTCLIASDIPLFEQLVDNEIGYKFNAGDAEDLARTLVQVAKEDPDKLSKKGQAGRRRVVEEWAELPAALARLYSVQEEPSRK